MAGEVDLWWTGDRAWGGVRVHPSPFPENAPESEDICAAIMLRLEGPAISQEERATMGSPIAAHVPAADSI